MKINEKVLSALTEDEKTSLTLQHGMDKSTWQGGEIMNRSHYKYLEISYRASHFFKIFHEHTNTLGDLVPDYLEGDKEVITYFRECIQSRKKPLIVLIELNNERRKNGEIKLQKTALNEKIRVQMSKWLESQDMVNLTFHDFVKEFDRWNNFRILPKSIQEPSAYKRRVQKLYKKHLKILKTLHPLSQKKLLKLFENPKGKIYLPLLQEVHTILETPQSMEILSELGLYVFVEKEKAEEYREQVFAYINKVNRECRDGLNFWPKYRELIKQAKNYQTVQNITPSRKYLQMAVQKLEFL